MPRHHRTVLRNPEEQSTILPPQTANASSPAAFPASANKVCCLSLLQCWRLLLQSSRGGRRMCCYQPASQGSPAEMHHLNLQKGPRRLSALLHVGLRPDSSAPFWQTLFLCPWKKAITWSAAASSAFC